MIFSRSGNFKSAIASLRSARGRSLLTMAGIIIGISSVITLVSLGDGLKYKVNSQIHQLGDQVLTIRSGSLGTSKTSQANYLALLNASTLTPQDVEIAAKVPGVRYVSPMSFVTSIATSQSGKANNISVVGTSQDFAHMLRQDLAYGSYFQDDWESKNFAVIGPLAGKQLFDGVNPLGRSLTVLNTEFRVAGILEPNSGGLFSVAETDFNSAIFIPAEVAYSLSRGAPNILQILVAPTPGAKVDQVISSLTAALTQAHQQQDFSVLKQNDLLSIAGGVIDTLTNFITAIAAIALLVGGIGIMDILLVSISERTREIGVRKAVGATNRQIMNQFMIEGLVLSVSGGVIGIVLALAINGLLRLYTSLQPIISIPVIVIAAGMAIVIGVVFSAAPALQAARKDPIEALRHE